MNAAQRINQDSGGVEYYTPFEIIEAARRTMGTIDLDPASNLVANQRVGAREFFTQSENGLIQNWFGNVWMNHPFGKGTNGLWIEKLNNEYLFGSMLQACCITFACTSEKWFQPLLLRPQCFLRGRTNYFLPDGTLKTGVTKGSVVTYYGANVSAFAKNFSSLGTQ